MQRWISEPQSSSLFETISINLLVVSNMCLINSQFHACLIIVWHKRLLINTRASSFDTYSMICLVENFRGSFTIRHVSAKDDIFSGNSLGSVKFSRAVIRNVINVMIKLVHYATNLSLIIWIRIFLDPIDACSVIIIIISPLTSFDHWNYYSKSKSVGREFPVANHLEVI